MMPADDYYQIIEYCFLNINIFTRYHWHVLRSKKIYRFFQVANKHEKNIISL